MRSSWIAGGLPIARPANGRRRGRTSAEQPAPVAGLPGGAGELLADARQLSTRELVSPRGTRVREHVYAAGAIGTVTLSDEHDAFAWVEDPSSLALTDSAAAALFSLAS